MNALIQKEKAAGRARRRQSAPAALPRVGRVVACKQGGMVLVEFDGSDRPVPARVLAGIAPLLRSVAEGQPCDALILFDGGDTRRPIVIGLLDARADAEPPAPGVEGGRPVHAVVDGRNVTIRAQEQLELTCGLGSITVRKDGKIVIRGTHLLSRSTGAVRIKGGHVEIN